MEPDPVASNRRLIVYLLLALLAAALLVSAGSALVDWRSSIASAARARDDEGKAERVLIISIDGLRPDLLLRAKTPHIRSMMDRGAYSMWARTTEMSITLPSHLSMLSGVRPDTHKIHWNHYIENAYPEVPTIFELAHKVKRDGGERLTTGLVAGKSKFHELAKPGTCDYVDVYHDKEGDNFMVGESAADMIRRHAPRVMFVHIADVDSKGHSIGWGTPQQMAAIETADTAVGMILQAIANKGLTRETFIILTADHGGQFKGHGPNDPRSRHIPWIAVGPNVRRNFDLNRIEKLPDQKRFEINTEDTFATACTVMGIPVPPYNDGRYIEQVYEPKPEHVKTVSDEKKPKRPDPFDEWWKPPTYNYERAPIPPHHAESAERPSR